MAMTKRWIFTDDALKRADVRIGEVREVIKRITDGEGSITECCAKAGMNMLAFRRVMYDLQALYEPEEPNARDIAHRERTERTPVELALTPLERFYADLNGLSRYSTEVMQVIPQDAEVTLEYVANKYLPDRDARILLGVYLRGKTYEEMGGQENITRQRVDQILNKSMRMLRHPARKAVLDVGLTEYAEAEKAAKRILEDKRDALVAQMVMDKLKSETVTEESIDVLGLGLRSTNCLYRAGIRTVEQIRNMGKRDLMMIRGLGEACVEEIMSKLKERDAV